MYNDIYIHHEYTNGIKKKDYINLSQQLEIYTYCSMNKQYVEWVQKWKKAYLMRESKIASLLYPTPKFGDMSLSFKSSKVKKRLRMGSDTHEAPNGHGDNYCLLIYILNTI